MQLIPGNAAPSWFFCLSVCHSCLSEDSLLGGMVYSCRARWEYHEIVPGHLLRCSELSQACGTRRTTMSAVAAFTCSWRHQTLLWSWCQDRREVFWDAKFSPQWIPANYLFYISGCQHSSLTDTIASGDVGKSAVLQVEELHWGGRPQWPATSSSGLTGKGWSAQKEDCLEIALDARSDRPEIQRWTADRPDCHWTQRVPVWVPWAEKVQPKSHRAVRREPVMLVT